MIVAALLFSAGAQQDAGVIQIVGCEAEQLLKFPRWIVSYAFVTCRAGELAYLAGGLSQHACELSWRNRTALHYVPQVRMTYFGDGRVFAHTQH